MLLCHPELVEGSVNTTSASADSLINPFKGYIEATLFGRDRSLKNSNCHLPVDLILWMFVNTFDALLGHVGVIG